MQVALIFLQSFSLRFSIGQISGEVGRGSGGHGISIGPPHPFVVWSGLTGPGAGGNMGGKQSAGWRMHMRAMLIKIGFSPVGSLYFSEFENEYPYVLTPPINPIGSLSTYLPVPGS